MRQPVLRALRLAHRGLGRFAPPLLFSRHIADIPGRVHIDDQMLASDAPKHRRHYLTDGLSAIANIEASLADVGRSFADVQSCLDLPCGYGRVTRHLVRRIDAARITASDIDAQGVRFCAAEFGVEPVQATPNPRNIRFTRRFDLIFVGSLLTHLPGASGFEVLDALADVLVPDGLLIFSTQGASCLRHLEWYGRRFAEAEQHYRSGLERFGIWHMPYGRGSYGVTLHAAEHLRDAIRHRRGPALDLVRYAERGWDDHQDVWAYRRVPDARAAHVV